MEKSDVKKKNLIGYLCDILVEKGYSFNTQKRRKDLFKKKQ